MSDGMSSVAQNAARVIPERYSGAIVAGLDVDLRQITFDCLDSVTGEVTRGKIAPTPAAVREWVARFPGGEGHAAMEACTGWLFVAEPVSCAGGIAHLAETAKTRALRGRKRRAKTDRQDAMWLREAARCGPAAGGVDRSGAHPPVAIAPASAQDDDR